jgi:hypothetical protein
MSVVEIGSTSWSLMSLVHQASNAMILFGTLASTFEEKKISFPWDRHKTFFQGVCVLGSQKLCLQTQVYFLVYCSMCVFICLFIYLQYWGLNSGLISQDRILWTICPGWLPNVILLISASWVARITGVSHQRCCVYYFLFRKKISIKPFLEVCLLHWHLQIFI